MNILCKDLNEKRKVVAELDRQGLTIGVVCRVDSNLALMQIDSMDFIYFLSLPSFSESTHFITGAEFIEQSLAAIIEDHNLIPDSMKDHEVSETVKRHYEKHEQLERFRQIRNRELPDIRRENEENRKTEEIKGIFNAFGISK